MTSVELPARRIPAVRPEVGEDRLPDVAGRRDEVVGVAELHDAPAIPPDEPERLRDAVELVEVEGEVVHGVLEAIGERDCPAMTDRALQQVRLHAAHSSAWAPIRSATSNPERQPSS